MLNRLIRWKTYIDRARVYIGYFQFVIMILVMLKVYDETTWGMWLFAHKLVLAGSIVVLFGIFIVVGYIDRWWIKPREITELQKANPLFMKMMNDVKEIKEKVSK